MIYANTGSGPDSIDAAVTTGYQKAEMVSTTTGTLPPTLTPQAAFKQRVIALDASGQSLKLWQDTMLRLNLVTQEFEVEGWGIHLKMSDAGKLPREMARQFLLLWSRTERGQLQGDDKRHWQQILDQVDFQAFSNERAPFLYTEGEVVGRMRDGTTIKWANGREEIVRGKFGREFDWVNVGEMFSAAIKVDQTGRIRAIENVTLLGVANDLLREMDDNWIQKV